MLDTVEALGARLAHAAFLEYRMNAATISATGLAVIRRMLAGEKVDQTSSGLSPREWRELMAVLGTGEGVMARNGSKPAAEVDFSNSGRRGMVSDASPVKSCVALPCARRCAFCHSIVTDQVRATVIYAAASALPVFRALLCCMGNCGISGSPRWLAERARYAGGAGVSCRHQ